MTIQLKDIIEKISQTVDRTNEHIILSIRQITDGDDIVRAYVGEIGESKRKDIYILTNTLLINVWEDSENGFNSHSCTLDSFKGVTRKIETEDEKRSVKGTVCFQNKSLDIYIGCDDKEGQSFLYQLEKVILELNKKNRAS